MDPLVSAGRKFFWGFFKKRGEKKTKNKKTKQKTTTTTTETSFLRFWLAKPMEF